MAATAMAVAAMVVQQAVAQMSVLTANLILQTTAQSAVIQHGMSMASTAQHYRTTTVGTVLDASVLVITAAATAAEMTVALAKVVQMAM